jgi:hypothetical protein
VGVEWASKNGQCSGVTHTRSKNLSVFMVLWLSRGGEYFFAPSIYFLRNVMNIGKKH